MGSPERQLMAEGLDILPEGFTIDQQGVDELPLGFTIDTTEVSPLEVPEPKEGPHDFMQEFPTPTQPVPEIVKRAAAAGVLFDKPAPEGQFLAGFAFDETERENAFRLSLKQKFGRDVKVRRGQQTGMIEFFDRETGRFSLAVPPGGMEFAALAGAGVTMTPEIILAVAATIVTRSPLLVEAGAGAGAFVGEILRLKMGQKFGINQEVTDSQILTEAAKVGAISAVSGVAFNKAIKAGKLLIDVIEGRVATAAAAKALKISAGDALKLQDEINSVLRTERFRLNLAQATNDEDLLVMQEFFKRSPQFAKDFAEFTDAQEKALREFFDIIGEGFDSRLARPELGGGPNVVGEGVQDTLRSGLDRQKQKLDIFVARRQADLDTAITSLRDRPLEDLGRPIRELGDAEQEAFRGWARGAAINLDTLAGNKEFIPNKNLIEAVRNLDEKVSRALFPTSQKPARSLIGDAGVEPATEVGTGILDQFGNEVTRESIEKIRNKIFDPNAKFTFLEAWDAISALKRIERDASRGLSTETPEVGAVISLYKALEKDLREGAASSPLRDQYDQFIFRYRAEKIRLDEGIVTKVMERSGRGRFKVADEDVFRTVFRPGGVREAKEFFELIKNDPQAMQGMRESIVDFYKREVLVDGRVNLAQHKQFMKRYLRPASQFFSKPELRALVKPGSIELALRSREAARKRALGEIEKTFEAKIVNLENPGQVLQLILDPKNPDKARALMAALERTPDVARAVKAEFKKEIAERVSGQFRDGERVFSAVKFNDFLNGKGGERGFSAVLENVFGKKYVDNLQKLNQALNFASREARQPSRANTAFWIDTVKNLTRAYVGLFTRPGRVITALDRLRGRASNRILARAILNPGELDALLKLRGVDLRTQKAAALIGALGGTALLQDFE